MVKIDVNRTELVWPGKYDEQGNRVVPPRVNLPFQVIETINESRATREAKKRPEQGMLFDVWAGDEGDTFEDGWRNKLIWGDNLLVMASLLEKFAGKIDLIYIDPPFATGADFSFTTEIGESGEEITKEQSVIEEKAYRDTWGKGTDSYLQMMSVRLVLMRDLLAENGSIYVHCDWRVDSHLRLILDEILGRENFRNEIIWCYTFPGRVSQDFQKRSDTILRYSKGRNAVFNADSIRVPYKAAFTAVRTPQGAGDYEEEAQRERHEKGKIPESWWPDISNVSGWRDELVGYPTQKPEAILERIIKVSSNPGSLVADVFCGSGTTAAVAEKLGRRWIAADLGRFAIHTTRKRLMAIEGAKPFEVLNLGRYERQYWQTASFGGRDPKQVVFEYLAFILRLYGAAPVAGMQHIHGKKGSAAIHVGNVDSPVTIGDVAAALDECVAAGQDELHVLGWEWEMGLNDLVDQLAADRKVRLKLLAIPREVMEAQAVEKKDIRFFELAHLAADFVAAGQRTIKARLTNFAMSGAEGIDPEILARIEKWSDFVDYWAVDWDFKNDTFLNGWVAYRTRKERGLPFETDPHRYDASGTYAVAVKVVDVFGNDTTRVFPVEVK